MRIITVRRISQIFFFTLFIWFCIATTVGTKFWQIRGWPINLFLHLDPLTAITTILTTHTLYKPLLWAAATIILTIIFGRFFCSWVCPFGSLHHFTGFLANKNKLVTEKIGLNKYRKLQSVKYVILVIVLSMAAFPSIGVSLQTGLLDPIPLVTHSMNLVFAAIIDRGTNVVFETKRFYEGAWFIFLIFTTAILLNLIIPRFYCRFVCPLGALFGILGRFAIWRIGKTQSECSNCKLCEKSCEGGCEPAGQIKISECVLCFNCRDDCRHNLIAYQSAPSAAGEITNPDISRRGFVLSLASGVLAVPAIRLSGKITSNWCEKVVRPPGALEEKEFLKRCIKCGQCMRVCPTNVIQPGGLEGGLENLWTPVLNNRIGSSGCQLNCVACGQVCPTAAIRPINPDEKHGAGEFIDAGPIKLGTAFVDRNRCLPWSMGRPCIVCQENCPVRPKAIYTEELYETVRHGIFTVKNAIGSTIETTEAKMAVNRFGSGDYYCRLENGEKERITENTEKNITIASGEDFVKKAVINSKIAVQIRLQRPYVDIDKCIGCGVCEHECPVSGKRAIRISAEGESRSSDRRLSI